MRALIDEAPLRMRPVTTHAVCMDMFCVAVPEPSMIVTVPVAVVVPDNMMAMMGLQSYGWPINIVGPGNGWCGDADDEHRGQREKGRPSFALHGEPPFRFEYRRHPSGMHQPYRWLLNGD